MPVGTLLQNDWGGQAPHFGGQSGSGDPTAMMGQLTSFLQQAQNALKNGGMGNAGHMGNLGNWGNPMGGPGTMGNPGVWGGQMGGPQNGVWGQNGLSGPPSVPFTGQSGLQSNALAPPANGPGSQTGLYDQATFGGGVNPQMNKGLLG